MSMVEPIAKASVGGPRLLNVNEVCVILGIGKSTVYAALIPGEYLHARKIGTKTLFAASEVYQLANDIASGEVQVEKAAVIQARRNNADSTPKRGGDE